MGSTQISFIFIRVFAIACLALAGASGASAQDPFVDAVHSFTPGTSSGFGATQLPTIVMGPPRGAGLEQGSFDVVLLAAAVPGAVDPVPANDDADVGLLILDHNDLE